MNHEIDEKICEKSRYIQLNGMKYCHEKITRNSTWDSLLGPKRLFVSSPPTYPSKQVAYTPPNKERKEARKTLETRNFF